MPSIFLLKNLAAFLLMVLALTGCAATYVPISRNFGPKVREMSRSDLTLSILYNRYDPQRRTLRLGGESFEEVMWPSEVKYHLGAYRPDTDLIYCNLYNAYSDRDLRDLVVHEFAHHIWFTRMTPQQHDQWGQHLEQNPSPLQNMVRQVYRPGSDYRSEDFAFTVEYARPADIRELARLEIINETERDQLIAELERTEQPAHPHGSARFALGKDSALLMKAAQSATKEAD